MKKKVLIPILAIGAIAAFFSFKYINNNNTEDNGPLTQQRKSLIVTTMLKAIKEGHFAPRNVDDSLSNAIYTKMLDGLDYDRKLFTQQDIDQLKGEQFNIDDELNNGQVTFFDKLNSLFVSSVSRAESVEKDILKQSFSFDNDEKIDLSGNKLLWPKDESALRERWRVFIKYRVLAKYVDLKKEREAKKANKDSAKVVLKSDTELEKEARESIGKNQDALFKRLKNFDENERFDMFVNTIANSEDPHTDFFAPKTKQRFDETMSGSFFGIGAQLKDEEGKVKVAAIIAGSPCWKQGELKAGDIITKVAQGAGEPLDIQGFELEDVVQKIRGKKGSEVRLTVKRMDGSLKVIPIIRDEVKIEETFAKSAIIKSPAGPVGYIYLPEFYADFQHINGRRCADDIGAELQKLKNNGVVGVILDLRNNGGGSLTDVVDMGGFFIDQGPIVQVKGSDGPPSMLRDSQKGILYDGPLAIMVNAGSGSASEILAAAMQDYKRAVIVGSNTYGKGTVQKVIGLEEYIAMATRMSMANEPPLGSLKLTVQKFYRINGGSTQLRGVTPDIILPDAYSQLDLGERKEKSALKWDEIPAANYQPLTGLNIPFLKDASNKRVSGNPVFKIIAESAVKLKERENNNVYSLKETAYRKELEDATQLSKKLEDLEKKGNPLQIINLKEDLKDINSDTSKITKNKNWLKNIQKDIYISETVNIVNDIAKSGGKLNMGMGLK